MAAKRTTGGSFRGCPSDNPFLIKTHQENLIDNAILAAFTLTMLWAGFTYILTSRKNTVLYTGATGNLYSRINQHKKRTNPGFSRRYNTDKLVYYECFHDRKTAFEREAQIKSWSRRKKVELINAINPEWKDLSSEIHNDRIDRYP